jgi:outer membrane receptor protein involved in Fe transport
MRRSVAFLLAPALAFALALALAPRAHAQSQAAGGAIEGTVTDQSGALLPGVAVSVRQPATGLVRETITDGTGVFRAPLLPVGSYEVSAALQGFTTVRRSNLSLSIGQTLIVDMQLAVAAAAEEVTVTAEAPIIESSRVHQASTVGDRAVANLPVNGRNFIDFVLTTPGVNRDTRGGDISFAGQRGTLNSLVIDGADNNNTFFGQTLGRTGSGRAPYQFSQDAVQEFQVNRNAYSAEYGRAGGAVINVVTKSGSNEYHGSAFEFFRDKSLNANSYANKVVRNDERGVPARDRSPFRIHQFGGSLGGPIVKDEAFFFVSFDGQRQNIPTTVDLNRNVPGGVASLPGDADTQAGLALLDSKAGDYNLTRDQDVFLAKLDWQLASKHRLTARYNHQNFTGENNENSGATSALEHTGSSLVRTRTVNLALASVFSATLYNEFRVQYARDSEPGEANSDVPEANVRQGGQTVLIFGRNFFSPRETTIKRFQVADTITWVRGAHSWKVGFDVLRDDILNFFPGNFGGRYFFNSIAGLGRGRPNQAGESFQQAFAGPGTSGATTNPDITEFAGFLQDEWRARKNLVLTFGVRYDLQSIAQGGFRNPDAQLAAAGIDTTFVPKDKDNVAPRVGVAWTPNSKTVVRAGYGLFYGRTPSIMSGTSHSGNGRNVQTFTLTGAAVPAYPNRFGSLDEILGAGGAAPKPSISVFDPDYENPEVHQASLGVDYALRDDLAVSASYLFVAGRKLQRSNDFNVGDPVPTEVPIQGGGSVTVRRYPTRPFTNFDRVVRYESTAESTYNGVTVELKRPFRGKFQGSVAYTLGKVEDTAPDAVNVVIGGGDDARFQSDPKDFELDRAAGNNDVRHRLVFSGYWDLGYWKDAGGFVKGVLDGWSLSWIAALQSGQPYSERVANDLNGDGNRSNDIVPGRRNVQRLPTSYVVDMRVQRRVPLGDRMRLDLIAEAFNLLNTTNISARRDVLYDFTGGVLVPRTNFGQDVGTQINFQDTQRIVQLAAKLTF